MKKLATVICASLLSTTAAAVTIDVTIDTEAFAYDTVVLFGSPPTPNKDTSKTQASSEFMGSYYDFGDVTTYAEGDNSGKFYSRGTGENIHHAYANVSMQYNITNINAPQNLVMEFTIDEGYLEAGCSTSNISDLLDRGYSYSVENDGVGLFDNVEAGRTFSRTDNASPLGCADTGDFARASYFAEILVNGTQIWHSSASLYDLDQQTQLVQEGTELAGLASDTFLSRDGININQLTWDEQTISLDLGQFMANESFDLVYNSGIELLGTGAEIEVDIISDAIFDDGYDYYCDSMMWMGGPGMGGLGMGAPGNEYFDMEYGYGCPGNVRVGVFEDGLSDDPMIDYSSSTLVHTSALFSDPFSISGSTSSPVTFSATPVASAGATPVNSPAHLGLLLLGAAGLMLRKRAV